MGGLGSQPSRLQLLPAPQLAQVDAQLAVGATAAAAVVAHRRLGLGRQGVGQMVHERAKFRRCAVEIPIETQGPAPKQVP